MDSLTPKEETGLRFGDKEYVAALTGFSTVSVWRTATGQRDNEKIAWALGRLKEMRAQLEKEYNEKFEPEAAGQQEQQQPTS